MIRHDKIRRIKEIAAKLASAVVMLRRRSYDGHPRFPPAILPEAVVARIIRRESEGG
jgi:hypothetical protein